MTFWSIILGAPLALCGAAFLLLAERSSSALRSFPRNRFAGAFLCAIAWFWTAYEIDALGIEVIDRIVQRLWFLPSAIPGAVWIWALILTFFTCWWMENLLPIRAMCAFAMLFPGDMFPAIRLCGTSWRIALVLFAYAVCIAGMWGMFYPWRIRQFMAWIADDARRVRTSGAILAALGAFFLALGALSAAGIVG